MHLLANDSCDFLLWLFIDITASNLFFFFQLEGNYNIVVGFAIHSQESAMGVHVFSILTLPPPSLSSHSSGSSQCTSPEHPVSCIEPGLVIYLHNIVYMFQCYSLKSSYPHLLPQSPKVCSLHLRLFCCLHIGSSSLQADSFLSEPPGILLLYSPGKVNSIVQESESVIYTHISPLSILFF